jgi:hypothetical protein
MISNDSEQYSVLMLVTIPVSETASRPPIFCIPNTETTPAEQLLFVLLQ